MSPVKLRAAQKQRVLNKTCSLLRLKKKKKQPHTNASLRAGGLGRRDDGGDRDGVATSLTLVLRLVGRVRGSAGRMRLVAGGDGLISIIIPRAAEGSLGFL